MRRPLLLAVLAVLVSLAAPVGAAAAPWGQRTLLEAGATDQAHIEVSPNGHAVATWADASGHVRVALRAPGHAWSMPATIATDTFPRVVSGVANSGKAVVVWSTAGPDLKYAIVDPNLTFTSGTVGLSGEFPSLSVTGAGLAALTFIDAADSSVRYGTMDLASATVFAVGGGGVNGAVPALTNGGPGPKIVTNQAGDIAVFFVAAITTPSNHYPLDAVFVPHGDTPGSPHEVSNDLVEVHYFDAALDEDGVVLAAWSQDNGGDVYANNATGAGAWGGPAPILVPSGGFYPLHLSAGSNGTADGAFVQQVSPPYASIRAFHFDGSSWLAPQVPSTTAGFATSVQVLELPAGATVIWNEFLSGPDYDTWGATRPTAQSTFGSAALIPSFGVNATIGPVAADTAGNAQALVFNHTISTGLSAMTYDTTAPALTASGPATLVAKANGSFRATASDAFAGLAGVAWHFSDGVNASGAAVSHAFATAGSYTATATATDGAGNATARTIAVRVLAPPDTTKPVLKLGPSKATLKKGKLKVTVSCANEVRCTGTITLKVGSKRVARKAFTAGGSKQKTVTLKVKLSKSAARKLAKKHKLSAKLSATATDAAGNKGTKSRTFSLRR